MASNTVVHSKMGIIDATGKVCQFCPKTSGMDVLIVGNEYGSGNTIQELNDNLCKIAFDKIFKGINDNAKSGITETFSTKKLNTLLRSTKERGEAVTSAYNSGCTSLKGKMSDLGVTTNLDNDPAVVADEIDKTVDKGYKDGYDSTVDWAITCNAQPNQIKNTKTFTSCAGTNIRGTMPVNGVIDKVVYPLDDLYTITGFVPAGSKVAAGPIYVDSVTIEFNISHEGSISKQVAASNVIHKILSYNIKTLTATIVAQSRNDISTFSVNIDSVTKVNSMGGANIFQIDLSYFGSSDIVGVSESVVVDIIYA